MSSTKLSVCMILRNEEEKLPRCLDSLRGVADELCVVDTGSTDRTMDICRQWAEENGVALRLEEHPWQDDFSLHRNQSLALATGDYVLVVDADEWLALPRGVEGFREALNQAARKRVDSLLCEVTDERGGREVGRMWAARMFRAGQVRYSGTVHNQPGPTDPSRPQKCEYFRPLLIRHDGYDLSPEEMRAKYSYREGLLKKRLDADPKDYEAMRYLGMIRGMLGDHAGAVRWFEEYLSHQQELGKAFNKDVYYNLVSAYIALATKTKPPDQKLLQKAARCCGEGLKLMPGHPDLALALADIGFLKGDLRLCAEASELFVGAYFACQNDPARRGTGFYYNLHLDRLAISLYRLATIRLLSGVKAWRQLMDLWPKLERKLQDALFEEARLNFSGKGLENLLEDVKRGQLIYVVPFGKQGMA